MQFVELDEEQFGRKVWVNPQYIVTALSHEETTTSLYIQPHIPQAERGWLTVKGALTDVAKKINAAMKA
jgi:hypothetical protein